MKHRLLQHLRNRERKVHGNSGNDLSMADVEEVTQEVGEVLFGWLIDLVFVCMSMCSAARTPPASFPFQWLACKGTYSCDNH